MALPGERLFSPIIMSHRPPPQYNGEELADFIPFMTTAISSDLLTVSESQIG